MYSIEAQRFGLKKEAVRGTAETTPDKWYPFLKGTEFNYALGLLDQDVIKGNPSRMAPIAGAKSGTGKVKLLLDSQTCVEFFRSLLGGLSSAQQGGSAAYKHTIVNNAGIQKPPYTFFLDYGIDVKKYSLGVVKKMALASGVDNLATMEADILFKSEVTGSIGSPSFPTAKIMSFNMIDFKIAGTSNTDVKDWSIEIDNGAAPHRTLSLSQDASDIIAAGPLDIKGGFTIYFQNETERAKFLANTAVTIRVLAVGPLIAASYYNTVDINIYEAHYKAFPFGEDQGLLAAKVEFVGCYSTGDSKDIQVDVTNATVSY